MNIDPETIKWAFGAAGTLLGGCVTAGGLWWRASAWVARTEAVQSHVVAQVGKMADTVSALTHAIARFETVLADREKGQLKLEGQVEQTQKNLMTTISTIQQCVGSLDALWRTLQKLFPEHIPARLSDRRNGQG